MFESIIFAIGEAVVVAAIAYALGYYTKQLMVDRRNKRVQAEADRVLSETKAKCREMQLEAKDEALRVRADTERELRELRADIHRQERRLQRKEEGLDRRGESQEQKERDLADKETALDLTRAEIETLKQRESETLEQISGLTHEQAKEILLKQIEEEVLGDAARRIRLIEAEAKAEGDRRAREIVTLAIQRCAVEQVTETTVSVVPLPSDDMKGRIIGREGRNIRALEQATGIDLIVDDTPEAVILSGFDPVRREVARVALSRLVLDGRIHPARIEEAVARAKVEVDGVIQEEGEQSVYKANVHGLHPELVKLMGRLKFRTSYGQNCLIHSIEVAHLSGMIAGELGADVNIARTAGFLHDIGKAVDHEVEGPHAQIGADILKRFGRSQRIVHAVAAHHGEEEPNSVEAHIVTTADAISSARPGARRESLENYIKRLEALENVANSFEGVEKSFAIQAGREVRILVKPEDIDDLTSIRLARDVVRKIEETLEYPGQIKVTVIRETRAVDYAK